MTDVRPSKNESKDIAAEISRKVFDGLGNPETLPLTEEILMGVLASAFDNYRVYLESSAPETTAPRPLAEGDEVTYTPLYDSKLPREGWKVEVLPKLTYVIRHPNGSVIVADAAEISAVEPTPRQGCELDTDGDGNCPIHPKGCPSEQPTQQRTAGEPETAEKAARQPDGSAACPATRSRRQIDGGALSSNLPYREVGAEQEAVRLRYLLNVARAYVHSFAELTQYSTARADAMRLIERIDGLRPVDTTALPKGARSALEQIKHGPPEGMDNAEVAAWAAGLAANALACTAIEIAPLAPIAKLTILKGEDNGAVGRVELYPPGLPPGEHEVCLCPSAPPATLTDGEHPAGDGWVENAEYLLKHCPFTIRVREGGGPENLLSSLVVTFQGMQRRLEKSK